MFSIAEYVNVHGLWRLCDWGDASLLYIACEYCITLMSLPLSLTLFLQSEGKDANCVQV